MSDVITATGFTTNQMFTRQRVVRAAFMRPAVRVAFLGKRTHNTAPYIRKRQNFWRVVTNLSDYRGAFRVTSR